MAVPNFTKSKKKSADLTDAKTWRERYNKATSTQERMFRRFADWYDLMYAHMNGNQYALWRSKVFLPIIASKGWSMIAQLTALKPGFEVGLYGDALNDPQAQERAEKAQWKLEHDWDNPDFDQPMEDKSFPCLLDALVTGTGIAKVPWKFCNKVRYEQYVDPMTGAHDPSKVVKVQTDTGYNDLIPHDIMATYIHPGAKDLYSAQWVILEDWVTYDQLVAENEAAGTELYKNLDEVKDMKTEADRFAREKQSRRLMTTDEDPLVADLTVKQFKRVECYEKKTNYVYVYAIGYGGGNSEDQWVELASRPLPYWHGKYPLVAFYVKKRPHNFWGQGIFEDTERMQAAFNDIFNHYMDNLNLSLDGMIMKQEGESYDYVVQPGGEFLYQNQPPTQFKFPDPNPNQFDTIMNFIESQVEEATISRYATGTPNSSTDKTHGTAAGIMKLAEMAGDKLGFFKQNYQVSLRQIGQQWLSNDQQFMDTPTTIMGQKDNRPAPVTITPADLQGQMVLRINDASMAPASKEEQLQQFQAYLQQALALQQASVQQAQLTKWAVPPVFFDFAGLFQDLSYKMGQANFDKVVMASDEVEQKIGQNPGNAFLTPNQRITYSIDDLYGTEAAQLLQRDGIQPDPQRQGQVPTPAPAASADNPYNRGETVDPHAQAVDEAQLNLKAHDQMLRAHDQALKEDQQQFDQGHKAAQLALQAQSQAFNQQQTKEQPKQPAR